MNKKRIDNCIFSNWYPVFKHVTFKSYIIKPLSQEFISYLNSDGIVLPANGDSTTRHEIQELSDDSESESSLVAEAPFFPELQDQIDELIDRLGGIAFIKLNWSSPKDASWMMYDTSLKCRNASDVFLLLKSSDFIAHDLSHAYDVCDDSHHAMVPDHFELVLREWCNLSPATQFRCFVRRNTLIAVSARDTANFYAFVVQQHSEIRECILNFFIEHIQDRFPDADYTFDVYYTTTSHRMYLMDFNPFCSKTDTLLFTWSELVQRDENNSFELRIINSQSEAHNTIQPSFSFNRVPTDAFDFQMAQFDPQQ